MVSINFSFYSVSDYIKDIIYLHDLIYMRGIRELNDFILLMLILFITYIRYFTSYSILEDRSLLDALLISLIVLFLAYIINFIAGSFIL
jgi:hypothetical protein